MRTFDDTGKEFLGNYIGRDYANALSSIEERHAVVFGRGSSCDNPVLLRLNDRNIFVEAFRERNPLPVVETIREVVSFESDEEQDQSNEFDDSIPF